MSINSLVAVVGAVCSALTRSSSADVPGPGGKAKPRSGVGERSSPRCARVGRPLEACGAWSRAPDPLHPGGLPPAVMVGPPRLVPPAPHLGV